MHKRLPHRTLARKQFMLGNTKNLIITLLTIGGFSLSSLLIAFVMQYATEAMETREMKRLYWAVALGLAAAASALIASLLEKVYRNRYIRQGLSQFKNYMFAKLFEKPISQFASSSNSQFISAFSNDLNAIEGNYLIGVMNIIMQAVLLVGGVASMFIVNWFLAICVLITAAFPAAVALIYGRKVIEKEKQTSAQNMGFVDSVKDLLSGFIVVKSFKAEQEVLYLFDKQNSELEEVKRDRRETGANVSIISDTSSTVVTILMVAIGIYLVFGEHMTIGGLLAFIQLQNYVMGPIQRMVPLWTNFKAASALIDKLADSVENEEDAVGGTEKLTDLQDAIRVENVSFAYEAEKPVLQDVSVTFEKGKSYAIVGGSGSGKSTLLSLLMGHSYQYTGNIYYDSHEMRDIDLDSLYDVVSVIQQNVFLFDSSIQNNITMFKEFADDAYRNAVSMAGLSQLLEERGDDTPCGAGGSALSGGEKQRVSIARCLLRGTPVLLMDEATGSLDNATSTAVDNAILGIHGLTRIVVTHKLEESVLRQYDEIIVLHNGVIQETGTFAELMQNRRYFFSLFNVMQGL